MFLDVSTGFPGSVHNTRMLRASTLYQKCETNELLTRPEKIIEEMRVRPLLLGDGAYPSTAWLVKPYPTNTRVIVERGFGLLKGRWRYCENGWIMI